MKEKIELNENELSIILLSLRRASINQSTEEDRELIMNLFQSVDNNQLTDTDVINLRNIINKYIEIMDESSNEKAALIKNVLVGIREKIS